MKNGRLSMHHVTGIRLETRNHDASGGLQPFTVNKIYITDIDGNEFELSCFMEEMQAATSESDNVVNFADFAKKGGAA